ncbi:MAG: hypothetical protein RDV41_16040, partial [Planctomycetota bacterium]|nr:hypothetical protein [Planctomycetota bacterium]
MNTWVVDYRDGQGRRHVVKAGSSKTVAIVALNAKIRALMVEGVSGLPEIEKKPFNEVADEYMAYARAGKRSWHRDERSLKHLRAAFGNKPLSSLSVRDVEEYKTA